MASEPECSLDNNGHAAAQVTKLVDYANLHVPSALQIDQYCQLHPEYIQLLLFDKQWDINYIYRSDNHYGEIVLYFCSAILVYTVVVLVFRCIDLTD